MTPNIAWTPHRHGRAWRLRNVKGGALPSGAPAVRAGGRLTRLIDVVGAAALLVVLAPALLLIAALVRLTSRGPALFRQERVGYRGSCSK